MTAISLSNLTKVNVSTYENPDLDQPYYIAQTDLEECGLSTDDIDIEDNFDITKFSELIAQEFEDEIISNIPDFKERLLKYGIIYTGCHFYRPQYYNFEGDSFDIKVEQANVPDNIVDWLEKHGLQKLVQEYIDNVRVKSCDGYMSFEPSNLADVDRDDYCVFRAILKKENIFDDIKQCLIDVVEETYFDVALKCCDIYYTKEGDDKKYIIDYEKSTLMPLPINE